MNFIRKMLAGSAKEELAVIPAGQLFLVRQPNSLKGKLECLFKDAVMTIRRTSMEYNYQLAVERAYEEGEEGLDTEDSSSDLDDNKDEWSFLLDESRELSYFDRDGHIVISWIDTTGEPGDRFEFVCDRGIQPKIFDQFDRMARICQYERKYQQQFSGGDSLLEEFDFDYQPDTGYESAEAKQAGDQAAAAAVASEVTTEVPSPVEPATPAKAPSVEPVTPLKAPKVEPVVETPKEVTVAPVAETSSSTVPFKFEPSGEILLTATASLHLFDPTQEAFIEQAPEIRASVQALGSYEYWLDLYSDDKLFLGTPVTTDLNPCFNYEHLSFIFNSYREDLILSFLLKFPSFEALEQFQQTLVTTLWETLNKRKWVSISDLDREYVTDAMSRMDIDEEGELDGGDNGGDDDEGGNLETEPVEESWTAKRADFDEDEEHDEEAHFDAKGKNSQLAVGMSNDRSYVVRGDKIGVFKHNNRDGLEFSTTIDKVTTPGGHSFAPKKVMLYTEDRALVLQDPDAPENLYRMDLERGQIVDEWKIDDGLAVQTFGPSSKLSQTTGEQTFLGLANRSVFRVDPRLAERKVVEKEVKQYMTRGLQFKALATTEDGNVAVASASGDIRLYNNLGIAAKTHIPALGDEIIGLDVSKDGKWILATCKTYLLLVDVTIREGRNAGSIGFQKSFDKDKKPVPRRLQISPEHVAFMSQETRKPLSFTKAHFNIGVDTKEATIVTSTGPYVISWSLKKTLRGDKEPYLIKRYANNVMADNFKFGTDKSVIVALEDDVGMVSRRSFRKPTRESLATPARRVQAASRNSIVNSPF